MKRRSFIKQNTVALAGIPFISITNYSKLITQKNPDFPFVNDFPEIHNKFDLYRELIHVTDIKLSRSVENEISFISGEGSAVFNGKKFPATIILDVGREIVGDYSFFAESKEDCKITVTYGEGLDEVMNGFGGISWYQHPTDIFIIKSKNKHYSLKGRRAFRYLRIDTTGEFTLNSLDISLQHYPVEERGSFYCSDVTLNQMWRVGTYTTKLCMQQFYEDGVKRDGLLWVSDYRVQFLCNVYSFGDVSLARKSLFMIAASQRKDGAIPACAAYGGGHQHPWNINYMGNIPFSFGAHWILINYSSDFLSCLNDYVKYSGDFGILKPMFSTVERLVSFLESVDYRPNADTPMGRDRLTDDAGVPSGQKGILQGTFLLQVYMNLKDGQELLKDYSPLLTDRLKVLAKKIENTIDGDHYDSFRKVYTDFPGNSGQVSWHTNSFAVLSGKVKSEEVLNLLKRTDELTEIEPAVGAMKMFQVAALFEAGWVEKAVSEMKRYWGTQIKEGATTFWEYLKLNPKPENFWESALMSRCHGWSAGPAYLLPRYFLGVRPKDSWLHVVIEPHIEFLEWAEGKIPTPNGDIVISWERGKKVNIFLPEGVGGEFVFENTTRLLESNVPYEILL